MQWRPAFCNSLTPATCYGSLAARTFTFSIDGGAARSSGAFAVSAAALPGRCACGQRHLQMRRRCRTWLVPSDGKPLNRGQAPLHEREGAAQECIHLASSFTNNATVTIFTPLSAFISKSDRTHLNTDAKSWCAIQGSNL